MCIVLEAKWALAKVNVEDRDHMTLGPQTKKKRKKKDWGPNSSNQLQSQQQILPIANRNPGEDSSTLNQLPANTATQQND